MLNISHSFDETRYLKVNPNYMARDFKSLSGECQEWCNESLKGKVIVRKIIMQNVIGGYIERILLFEDQEDLLLFKLRWQ